MITKCVYWIKKSRAKADEYYRAMTTWVTSRRTKGSVKALITLASAYRTALDKVLVCLRKLRPSAKVESEIENTQHYKSLIVSDIQMLSDLKK